eukprot:scaffold5287_cov52-Phaeocystis_antarctica.AAC.1
MGKGGGGGRDEPLPLALRPDALLSPAELQARYPRCGAGAHAALASIDYDAINYELIVQLVAWLKTCPGPHAVSAWLAGGGNGARGVHNGQHNGAAANGAANGAAAGGGGGGGGAAASREERRFDLDGELYTRAEFVKEYLGAAEWDAAERPPPQQQQQAALPPPPNPKKGGNKKKGGGGEGAVGGVNADGVDEGANAILIFLSGFKEIQTLHEALLATKEYATEPQRSW